MVLHNQVAKTIAQVGRKIENQQSNIVAMWSGQRVAAA